MAAETDLDLLADVSDDNPEQDDEEAVGPTRQDTGKKKETPAKETPAPDADDEPGDGDDDPDLAALLNPDAEDEEPEPAEPEKKPDERPDTGKKPAKPDADKGKVTFSTEQQAYINQLLTDRLARDRATRERETENLVKQATGKTLAELRQEQVEARVQQLTVDSGVDEATARQIAAQEAENRELRAQQAEAQAARERADRTTAYVRAKAQHTADPLVKLYEADIDAFADGGTLVDFDAAANYVLGQRVRDGSLIKRLTASIERRVLKQVTERGKVAPEGRGGGTPAAPPTNPYERKLIREMGLSKDDEQAILARKAARAKKR